MRIMAALLLAVGISGCWFGPKPKPAPEPPACECEHDDLGEFNCICPTE